jgi:hypothetical protein
VQELRGNVLEVEYGRQIAEPLPPPLWEQNQDDGGRARGNLFLTQNSTIQRALSYLVLIQYMHNEYFDDFSIHQDSTPDTVSYDYIMWVAQLAFDVQDWSETFVSYGDTIRPPFTLVEQILDDGLEFEHLQISESVFVCWWNTNQQAIINEFNCITSRVV